MPGILLFHRIESDTLFALTCDLVVFCNLVQPATRRVSWPKAKVHRCGGGLREQ